MNITAAILQARDRRDLRPNFQEKVEIVTCLLRAKEVLPYRRAIQNGSVHHDLAGAIALALELGVTLDVRHKSAAIYHADGVSTMMPTYLKRCLEAGILEADNDKFEPHGRLRVTNLVERFIA